MANASPARITVLISGGGSNLQALIDAANTPSLPNTHIVRVISNRKSAFGLQRAEKAGIPTLYHNLMVYKKRFPDPAGPEGKFLSARNEFDKDLANLVLEDKPDIVVCAGWMHILAPTFLNPLKEVGVPVINLHPALPGKFNGVHAIERAWEAFQKGEVKGTGVMVHHVIPEVDMGTPILVREVEIRDGETVEELEERIHATEWKVIVEATKKAIDEMGEQKHGAS
ncbi:phosphoribosylglycinamide formyltransferase [Sphaceloma murrayae]|uniref:Phosphoribosylglycinamide formyltransferase n=1 Tax=Sphaceloma murrayae TaxID=2082308 RepID=A0A2K1QZP7_9PEZI|nr:phosphoribosylglycinamide formyltransferase [Sphaceloma murrayae]